MRLAIISDIHGNLEAFKEVLADIDNAEVDSVACLGDNVGYGPEPEEVVRLIRQRNIPCVMGNHELVLAKPTRLGEMNPSSRKSALLTPGFLSQDSTDYVRTLKPSMIFHGALCVHGCPPDSVTKYLFTASTATFRSLFLAMKEKICFAGHTHDLELIGFDGERVVKTPLCKGVTALEKEKQYIINAGSVGQPRDGNNNAKYVIWDTGARSIDVRFIPYDIEKTVNKILALDLPEFNATRLW